MNSKIMKRSLSAVAMLGLLSFGACSVAFPGMVLTNGESYAGAKNAKDISTNSSTEMLFGVIGLNNTGQDTERNGMRERLANQCQGGKLENLSFNTTTTNYLVYVKVTETEHATCVMPDRSLR